VCMKAHVSGCVCLCLDVCVCVWMCVFVCLHGRQQVTVPIILLQTPRALNPGQSHQRHPHEASRGFTPSHGGGRVSYQQTAVHGARDQGRAEKGRRLCAPVCVCLLVCACVCICVCVFSAF